MARAAFERLEVYRLAERLSDHIWELAMAWRSFPRDTVGKQLVRAVDSVGANIAEGYGRGDIKDHKRFVRIARGSLNETLHWLRRAHQRHLLTREQVGRIRPLIDELGPRLNAYLKSIGTKKSEFPTRNLQPTTNNKH